MEFFDALLKLAATVIVGFAVLAVVRSLWNQSAKPIVDDFQRADGRQVLFSAQSEPKNRAYESHWLPKPVYVKFDASDYEHVRAMNMLRQNPARQHPTLRFEYSIKQYDNAFQSILNDFIDYHVSVMETNKERRNSTLTVLHASKRTNHEAKI